MTPKRVALYLVGGSVLAAWLAAAAGVESPAEPSVTPAPVKTSGTETLADEVQTQAVRLRERLAGAPAPTQPSRNLFAFAPKPAPKPRAPRPAAAATTGPPSVPTIPEPVLSLIGVAEDQSDTGPIRTAILTAESGELFMVRVGDSIGPRYRVDAIGADAVELSDLITGVVRRLALR